MSKSTGSRLSRRQVFAGAGAVGALAAVAAAVPVAAPQAEPAAAPKPTHGGGYRVTQHVLRYYQTTKV